MIGECHSSQIDDEVTAKYRSINDSQDRELFIEFCLHTVLYQPPSQRYRNQFSLCVILDH